MMRRMNWKGIFIAVIGLLAFSKSYSQCGNVVITDSIISGCFSGGQPAVVRFIATGLPTGSTSLKWDFGDGSGLKPGGDTTYGFYTKAGVYTIKFQFYATGAVAPCNVSSVNLVNLNGIDTVYFNIKPGASYCSAPATITLIDSTPNVASRVITRPGYNGQDTTGDTARSITFTVGVAGTFDVTYTDKDNAGCTKTVTKKGLVYVPPALTADFFARMVVDSTTNTLPAVTITAYYTAHADTNNTAVTYIWSFPGSSVKKDTIWYGKYPPPIIYKNIDTGAGYDVKLTIKTMGGTGCSDSFTKHNLITKYYTSINNSTTCRLSPVALTLPNHFFYSNGPSGYYSAYQVGTSVNSAIIRVNRTLNNLNFKGIGVSVINIDKNSTGSSYVDSFYVNHAVNVEGPFASFAVTKNAQMCLPPDTAWVHAINGGPLGNKAAGTKYYWYLLDSTGKVKDSIVPPASDTLVSFIIKDSGAYGIKVKMYNTFTKCTDSASKQNVILIAKPRPAFKLSDSAYGYVCNNEVMHLFDATLPTENPANPYKHYWKITNADTSGVTSTVVGSKPSYTPSVPGWYDIQYVVTNGGECADTTTKDSVFYVPVIQGKLRLDLTGAPQCVSAGSPAMITAHMDTTLCFPRFKSANNNKINYKWIITPWNGYTLTAPSPLAANDTTDSIVTIVFTQTGSYSISCQVADTEYTCIYTFSKPNVIGFGTIAGFNLTPPCKGVAAQIANTSMLSPTSYKYTVSPAALAGNVTFSPYDTSPSPTVVFSQNGKYQITLTTSKGGNADCSSTFSDSVDVSTPLDSFWAPNSDTLMKCAPKTANFTVATDASITQWLWHFGDGDSAVGSSSTISHQYLKNNPAGYTVTLTTTNGSGCTATRTINNYIKIQGPVPSFTANTRTACGDTKVTIINHSTGVDHYTLDFKDGSPIISDSLTDTTTIIAVHDYLYHDQIDDSLIFTPLMFTTGDSGCIAIDTFHIKLYMPPVVKFTITPDSGCALLHVSYNGDSSSTGTFLWQFGIAAPGYSTDNGTSASTKGIHIYDSGKYIIKLTVSSAQGCKDSLTDTIYSIPAPKAAFGITNLSDSVCSSDIVNFVDQSTTQGGPPIANWYWTFDSSANHTDTDAIGQTGISHTFTTPGWNSTTLSVVSTDGCPNSVTVNQLIYVRDTVHPQAPTIEYVTLDTTAANLKTGSKVYIHWSNNSIVNFADWKNDFLFRNNISPGIIHTSSLLNDTVFVDSTNVQPDSQSYSYGIYDVNKCGLYSDTLAIHSTINLSVDKVPNFNGLSITWTGYRGWGSNLSGYALYRMGANKKYTFIKPLSPTDTSYIDSSLCDSVYEYFVEGINTNQNFISFSNIDTNSPAYVYQTTALELKVTTVVNNDSLKYSWTPGTQSNIKGYTIDRWTLKNGWRDNYYFRKVYKTTTPDSLYAYDSDVDVHNLNYIYRANVMDDCGNIGALNSNDGKSILLKASIIGDKRHFVWNSYDSFPAGVNYYIMYLKVPNPPYWVPVSNHLTDTTWIDDSIYSWLDTVTCYRVKAYENFNPVSLDTSVSNDECLDMPSRIWVPNAFTPNGDQTNDSFYIVSASLYNMVKTQDLEFDFRIYDRWGTNVFETHNYNEGWKGTRNGIDCPAGVYVWIIQAHGRDGHNFYLKGQVTLLR